MDRHEYLRHIQWSIASCLAEHELLGEEYWDDGRGARWVIGIPDTFVYRAEIIAGIGGSLIVHGDVDISRFAHYGDHKDAWSRLRWMAFCSDVDYYVAQKASIGMGHGRWEEYDDEVARHDLDVLVREYEENEGGYAQNGEIADLFREAREYVHHQSELEEFFRNSYLYYSQSLFEHGMPGKVIPTPVVMGHLYLQRCAYLLLDKYGDAGPPACRGTEAK
jgi:hypothetical protein